MNPDLFTCSNGDTLWGWPCFFSLEPSLDMRRRQIVAGPGYLANGFSCVLSPPIFREQIVIEIQQASIWVQCQLWTVWRSMGGGVDIDYIRMRHALVNKLHRETQNTRP